MLWAVKQAGLESVELLKRFDDRLPASVHLTKEDPFAEGTLKYRRTQDGFVIYSVGPDGQDNGSLSTNGSGASGIDIGWAFRSPQLSQGANAK